MNKLQLHQAEIRRNVISNQINRLITVKANILKQGRSKYVHPTNGAIFFIHNYDNPSVCHSTEEMVFSAMQEGVAHD